jgi:MATE family multidrug resistance protein
LSELKIIARHAATVVVGQLATMAYGVTDTIVAGRYSDTSLAALSVGSAIFISVYVALMGVLQSLLPVWAEFKGARRFEQVGQSFRQALYLCAITILIGEAILLFPAVVLQWTDVPPALRPEVERYLAVLAMALPPAMLFRMYSTLNQSLGRPQLVTWLQMGSIAGENSTVDLVHYGRLGLVAVRCRGLRLGDAGGELWAFSRCPADVARPAVVPPVWHLAAA